MNLHVANTERIFFAAVRRFFDLIDATSAVTHVGKLSVNTGHFGNTFS